MRKRDFELREEGEDRFKEVGRGETRQEKQGR